MSKIFSRENLRPAILIISATLISALCWYLSFGLTGKFWYLLWIAPLPVFWVALTYRARTAFLASFIAFFIGRMSWYSYLAALLHSIPAIIDFLVLSLIFTLVILISRKIIMSRRQGYAVFAFPVLWTTFEFILSLVSPDGTAGSMAYSQSNVLSLVQVASVTGVTGITFIITLVPSVIAVVWYFRKIRLNVLPAVVPGAILVLAVFAFGWIRLGHKMEKPLKVGLSVLQESFHSVSTDSIDAAKEFSVSGFYAQQAMLLAREGAQAILLPERAITIETSSDSIISAMLSRAARNNNVFIITGYTNLKNKLKRNSALVIDTAGHLVVDYNKVHLVKGLEDIFTAGNNIATFGFRGLKAGVAICKDLDFPGYIRNYGKEKIDVLFIPAWDFRVDDWLHSRMAVLRGVENGFSEVRCAREGRMTISDPYGRIHYESISADKSGHTLIDAIPLHGVKTVYTSWGSWFGYTCTLGSVFFLALLLVRPRKD